nr:IniB N-terminal domain-containing protein [Pseudarthrobacter psychrotolerans]
MPTLANDLVLFLMSLFGNEEAAKEFLDDPERSLENAGLGGVCSADVDAALPVVLDYAPITIHASSFDRSYNTGGNGAATGGGAVAVTPTLSGGGNGDHTHAIQQLHNVVNNYSYTSTVDDRDTITDQSVNQNIWADGDVEQWFDNDSVIASGDRAVAAGDDVDMDDSNNIEDSYNRDNSNDSSTDNSVNAGRDAEVGNTEINAEDDVNL